MKESLLHGNRWSVRGRAHDMCTAVNRVLLRRFTGLFNDNLSIAKVKLRKVDETVKYRNNEKWVLW
jgi:hypothetical protein